MPLMDTPADLRFKDDEPRIHPTSELKGCRLGRHVAVGERVVLREVVVGDYSYFERHAEAIYTSIGKFCSIAANTRINALEHPMERLTTHKVSYRPNEYFRYLGVDGDFRERAKEAAIRMASKNLDMDVEIGSAGPAFMAVVFRDIRVRTRPMTGKPTRFTIDSAKFSPSILALFTSSFPFTLTMEALGGKIELDQSGTPGKKGGFRTELSAH